MGVTSTSFEPGRANAVAAGPAGPSVGQDAPLLGEGAGFVRANDCRPDGAGLILMESALALDTLKPVGP
jgi:hypothetical protein